MMMHVPARKVGVQVGVVEEEMLPELVGEMQVQPHNVKMVVPKGVEDMFKLEVAVAEEMVKKEVVLAGEEMFKVAVAVAEQILPHMLELVGEET